MDPSARLDPDVEAVVNESPRLALSPEAQELHVVWLDGDVCERVHRAGAVSR